MGETADRIDKEGFEDAELRLAAAKRDFIMEDADMPTLVDVSHTVADGLITYKGLPAPIICDYLSREASRKFYAPGTEFQIGKIEMVANTGTYLDSPFHRYADGKDLSELEPAKVGQPSRDQSISPETPAIDRRLVFPEHGGSGWQGRAGRDPMVPPLEHPAVFRRTSVPDGRGSAVPS